MEPWHQFDQSWSTKTHDLKSHILLLIAQLPNFGTGQRKFAGCASNLFTRIFLTSWASQRSQHGVLFGSQLWLSGPLSIGHQPFHWCGRRQLASRRRNPWPSLLQCQVIRWNLGISWNFHIQKDIDSNSDAFRGQEWCKNWALHWFPYQDWVSNGALEAFPTYQHRNLIDTNSASRAGLQQLLHSGQSFRWQTGCLKPAANVLNRRCVKWWINTINTIRCDNAFFFRVLYQKISETKSLDELGSIFPYISQETTDSRATEKALEKRHAAIWHVSPLLQLALPWPCPWYPWVWIRGRASSIESINSN